jgi:hypothetical protein
MPGTVSPQGNVIVPIEKDCIYDPTEIAVTIGSDALTPAVSLPGVPIKTYRIESRELDSQEVGMDGGRVAKPIDACITLTPEETKTEMIVPNTLRVTPVYTREVRNGSIGENRDLRVSDDVHQACAYGGAKLNTDDGSVFGKLRLNVKVLVTEPVEHGCGSASAK